MAGSFGDLLAGAFGGGPNRGAEYMKGLDTGSQIKLRSAQTETALSAARENRSKAVQGEVVNANRQRISDTRDAMAATGQDTTIMDMMLGDLNPEQYTGARHEQQAMSFADTIANPNAPQDTRLAAMDAVKGAPNERYYDVGSGMMASHLDPKAAPTVTPIGQSTIDSNNALTAQRERSPKGVVVNGFLRDPFSGEVIGPADQYVDAIQRAAGARAQGTGSAKIELGRPQAEAYVQSARTGFQQTKGQIDQIINDPALWQGVSVAKKIGEIPGTQGAAVKGRLTALKSSLTQRALTEMRRASTTGGAVGQVTEREWGWLAATFGAMDENMSVQDFIDGAKAISMRLDQGMADTENAFHMQYGRQASPNARWGANGYEPPAGAPAAAAAPGAPGAAPAAAPKEGDRMPSKSGLPMVFKNGKWEYE